MTTQEATQDLESDASGAPRRGRLSPATSARERGRGDETGAILVLALIFLIVAGAIVGGLSGWVLNDLKNTAHFSTARSLQTAATAATQTAIQNIRYNPLMESGSTLQTLNASPPSACWGSGATSSLTTVEGTTSENMSVWCSTEWTPTSGNTRVVTLSTCLSTVSAAACASNPYLQAVVSFDDYPPGVSAPTTGQCVAYCGTGVTVNSWVWSPSIPIVSGFSSTSATSGPITGGTSVTVVGSGFVAGSTTVNFVEESGGAPLAGNYPLATGDPIGILPATVTASSSTSITATAPPVIAGTTYYITVTTPTGTSAYNPIFTYSPVSPTVGSISTVGTGSTAGGSTAGGTAVTITGTGFVTGSTVSFTQESGGSAVSPAVISAGSNVSVTSDTSMSAVSPAVTVGTTYFVTVTTPTGSSSYGPVFTYSPLVPTVSSVSVSAGSTAGGTGLTISGTGFISGATVNFVLESGGNPVNPAVSVPATSATVTGATTINVVSPALTAGTYFVTVTTSTNYTSSNSVVFTAS
jgi:hypothetical protein